MKGKITNTYSSFPDQVVSDEVKQSIRLNYHLNFCYCTIMSVMHNAEKDAENAYWREAVAQVFPPIPLDSKPEDILRSTLTAKSKKKSKLIGLKSE